MCILKKTDKLLNVNSYNQAPITPTDNISLVESDFDEIKEDFQECYEIPANFKQTAPPHTENSNATSNSSVDEIKNIYLNEQTTLYCEMLGIRDPIRVLLEKKGQSSLISQTTTNLYNNLLDESDDDNKNDDDN
jgi:hypothetical protein